MNRTAYEKKALMEPTWIAPEAPIKPLNVCVSNALERYFEQLAGEPPRDLYALVLSEVEPPLLQAVMNYTRGNQSKAADVLGINRGTLRKKLRCYGLD
jgi:Fis family transcriptional regulator